MTETTEGFESEHIESGKRLFVSPITGDPYLVYQWVEKGDGRFAAIEKERVEDRLFVPLRSRYWYAFADGEKDIELRGVNDQFNANTVYSGRPVELRRGYSTDDSLWGLIGAVWFFGSITSVADDLDYRRIAPDERNQGVFITKAKEMLDQYDRYVAFEVNFDGA